MKTKHALAFLVGALALVCSASADEPPKDKDKPKDKVPGLPLGRDTTFVIGPLDKNGGIDYEGALNAEMSKGVTAANNANVLLMRAFGPKPEGSDMPPSYYRWLDCEEPPPNGDYLIDIYRFTTRVIQVPESQREALYEFQGRATKYPWVAKDCPPLAEWIKGNEKPLALVHEAVKRERYFNPLVTRKRDGEPSLLIGVLLPTVQKSREFASLLSGRATLRLGEGKYDEAWADIVACFRLARHISYGGTLIEGLVGIAINQIAASAAFAYLDRAPLTADQARAKMKELADLRPLCPLVDKIGVCERMMGLDVVQSMRRGPVNARWLRDILEINRDFTDDEMKAYAQVDWPTVMQTMNKWYDRNAEVIGTKNRAARTKAAEQVEKDLKALKEGFAQPDAVKKMLEAKDAKQMLSKALGEFLMTNLTPASQKVMQAHDRAAQTDRTLQVAFALAAHKADTKKYPAQLADLAPKYLKDVPTDLFLDDKPLVYKVREKGYQFYSVGVNGKDDGGKTYGDDPPGSDDLGLALPLPEPKKP
jgi:hypothetical protein